MRNLLQYPVTLEEIQTELSRISSDIKDSNRLECVCGDMRPVILDKAVKIIRYLQQFDIDDCEPAIADIALDINQILSDLGGS